MISETFDGLSYKLFVRYLELFCASFLYCIVSRRRTRMPNVDRLVTRHLTWLLYAPDVFFQSWTVSCRGIVVHTLSERSRIGTTSGARSELVFHRCNSLLPFSHHRRADVWRRYRLVLLYLATAENSALFSKRPIRWLFDHVVRCTRHISQLFLFRAKMTLLRSKALFTACSLQSLVVLTDFFVWVVSQIGWTTPEVTEYSTINTKCRRLRKVLRFRSARNFHLVIFVFLFDWFAEESRLMDSNGITGHFWLVLIRLPLSVWILAFLRFL